LTTALLKMPATDMAASFGGTADVEGLFGARAPDIRSF
jgi:hypothetical protein